MTGQHFLYWFKFNSVGGNATISNAQTYSQKILGYGLLSGGKLKLYTGAGIPGGFSISTSQTIELNNIFGPMYWKENKRN